jgi:hypothetical protein
MRLHRINFPTDRMDYATAWSWMREQPDLYSEIIGFDSFGDFVEHPGEQIDFALKQDGELIAFASLVLKGRRSCEFELITPPRPRVRSILALLRELRDQYFEVLEFLYFFVVYPDDPRYGRPRRLCKMFGLRQNGPHVFDYSYLDHLKVIEQKEQL